MQKSWDMIKNKTNKQEIKISLAGIQMLHLAKKKDTPKHLLYYFL